MDFQVVETAKHSPTCCFICRESGGPFVHVHAIEFTDVATAEGRQTVEGDVYICIGRDVPHAETGEIIERKIGCARTLGRLGGLVDIETHEGVIASIRTYQDRIVLLEAREQELEQELAAEQAKPKTVDADALLAKIAETTAAQG